MPAVGSVGDWGQHIVVPLLWWSLVSSSTAPAWAPSLANSPARDITLPPSPLLSSHLGSSFAPALLAAPHCQHHAGYAQYQTPLCFRKQAITGIERWGIPLYLPSLVYCTTSCQKDVWQVVTMMQTVHTNILSAHSMDFSSCSLWLHVCLRYNGNYLLLNVTQAFQLLRISFISRHLSDCYGQSWKLIWNLIF